MIDEAPSNRASRTIFARFISRLCLALGRTNTPDAERPLSLLALLIMASLCVHAVSTCRHGRAIVLMTFMQRRSAAESMEMDVALMSSCEISIDHSAILMTPSSPIPRQQSGRCAILTRCDNRCSLLRQPIGFSSRHSLSMQRRSFEYVALRNDFVLRCASPTDHSLMRHCVIRDATIGGIDPVNRCVMPWTVGADGRNAQPVAAMPTVLLHALRYQLDLHCAALLHSVPTQAT